MTQKEKHKVYASQLGVKHFSKARDKLMKSMMLDLLKELGEDKCFRCKQIIDDAEELSLDHSGSWRLEKDCEEARKMFWDILSIYPSHIFCNTANVKPNGNKNGFIGIAKNGFYKSTGNFHYISEISVDGKSAILGYSKDPRKAGMFYDLGVMKYRQGKGVLNFEHLREFYKENINKDWSFVHEVTDGIFKAI